VPARELIEESANWFENYVKRTAGNATSTFDLLVPSRTQDLFRIEHPALQQHPTSHLWRFKPSALVIETNTETSHSYFHVLVVVSDSISLKDVGELNCYARIAKAKTGCLISSKGISNEVRLVQAELSVRNRLFVPHEGGKLFLVQWDEDKKSAITDSVIPIEISL
jgi:hypothetical protein